MPERILALLYARRKSSWLLSCNLCEGTLDNLDLRRAVGGFNALLKRAKSFKGLYKVLISEFLTSQVWAMYVRVARKDVSFYRIADPT